MRVSIYIALFLVFMTAGANMLISTGVAAEMGIDPATGNDEQIDHANDNASEIDAGSGTGGTLFGMYNSIAQPLGSIYDIVTAGPAMLKLTPIPNAFIDFLFAGATIIVGLDTIAFFRGYELV